MSNAFWFESSGKCSADHEDSNANFNNRSTWLGFLFSVVNSAFSLLAQNYYQIHFSHRRNLGFPHS